MDKFHQIPIPETDYQNLLKEKNIPIHLQWLEAFTRLHQTKEEVSLLGCDIYQDLKRRTDENGIVWGYPKVSPIYP